MLLMNRKSFLISWLVHTVALIIVAHLVSGIYVANWLTAIVAALVLGLLNTFLRPLFLFFTLPINIMSLGLFTLVINGFMFYFASKLVPGFTVAGFWSAIGGALLFSIISFLLNFFIKPPGQGHPKEQERPGNPRYRNVIDVETVPDKDKDKDTTHKHSAVTGELPSHSGE